MNVVHVTESSGRMRRRERTVARIVEAALRILTEEGFEALTMQRLANELGYAPGAFYRYFRSKDELLVAAQRRVLERLARELTDADQRAREHAERSPTVSASVAALLRILTAARVYETLAVRRPAHFRLLSRWLGEPEPMVAVEAAAPSLSGLIGLFSLVPELFAAAVAAGALRQGPAERRAYVLWSALQGALQMRKLDRFGLAALRSEALVEELYRALLGGWGASEAETAEALRRAKRLVAVEELVAIEEEGQ